MKPGDTVKILHQCRAHVVVQAPNGDLYCGSTLREGEAMHGGGSIVSLEPTEHRGRMRVTDVTEIPGPAKVSSPAYRKGWDRVFARTGRGAAN